eukprot:NODE_350_length_8989_cov_0.477684.p7 type:complete len:123 gc:universal NODE_350_length_8989_cov_0.477684:3597-3229(-)
MFRSPNNQMIFYSSLFPLSTSTVNSCHHLYRIYGCETEWSVSKCFTNARTFCAIPSELPGCDTCKQIVTMEWSKCVNDYTSKYCNSNPNDCFDSAYAYCEPLANKSTHYLRMVGDSWYPVPE